MIQRLGELGAGNALAFWLVLAACAYFAVMAVRLTVIDVRHHLLPNRIVFPSYGVAGALLLGAAASLVLSGVQGATPDGGAGLFGVPGLRILAGGAVLWLFYFLLRPSTRRGWASVTSSLPACWGCTWGSWAGRTCSPEPLPRSCSAASGAWGCWLRGAGTLKSSIPFGPFMLAGTAAAMLLLPAS